MIYQSAVGNPKPGQDLTPSEIRQLCRDGKFTGVTAGLAPGYVQANLVVLPRSLAFDFLLFCQRNPKPCPVLDVTDEGNPEARFLAPGADIRTDLPLYRIYRRGKLVEETTEIRSFWREDSVGFLIGCSFTFERAMLAAGLPVRHIEEGRNVPMYRTNRACTPAGCFSGEMVVSMRPMPPHHAIQAVKITSHYHKAHGAPVHIGDPAVLGIKNLDKPDYGNPVTIHEGEIPVFWACGVTPQAVILQTKPELAITHAPGHMFIADIKDEELAL